VSRLAAVLFLLQMVTCEPASAARKQAGEAESPQIPALTVRLYDYSAAPRQVLVEAGRQASRVFAKAGIEVAWADCSVSDGGSPRSPICDQAPSPQVIFVRMLSRAAAQRYRVPKSWFGFAQQATGEHEHGVHATLFYDRAEQEQRRATGIEISVGQLLGYVIAHEVGHLLLGVGSHAPAGIMRVPWRKKELLQITRGELGFSSVERQTLRANVLNRRRSPLDREE